MRPLEIGELVGIDAYEALRDAYRARVMRRKAERRLAVGDRVTLIFEDRETIRFQVQEMMRVERLRDPEKIQDELDVYNELLPGDGEVSATLLVEITDASQIRAELDRLVGIDAHVFLELGAGADALRAPARFDASQLDEGRISAVHYLKFALGAGAAARLRDPSSRARAALDHPAYRASAELPAVLRAQLAADLEGDPSPLLMPSPGGGVADARDGVLFESARVWARRPDQPIGRAHVVVEPRTPVPSLLEADAALEAELLDAVKRAAREILARHGRCRVSSDLHAGSLRFDVFSPD
ncbi:MAG TPA: DUF3501 family protein [Myxococcota bacterium]|nr:DUF3501 family protein [Myxococcota bacterium]